MIKYVIKRNGKKVKFNKDTLKRAVFRAYISTKEPDENTEAFITKIANDVEEVKQEVLSVEEIQDIVEKKLMASAHKDVAKNYITYRQLRTMARSQYNELWENIAEKLTAKNVKNQNANVDEHSFGGRLGEAAEVVTKKYALEFLISEKAKQNHLNNEIYIHDLGSYSVGNHNCLSIPFDDLLKNGFNTRQIDVRPAKSVQTACQLVAVLFQLQSLQQFGGVSATHLDWTLVPYVRYSFYKHYNDGIKYLHKHTKQLDWDSDIITDISITDNYYKKHKKAYRYAYDMTVKEIYQAVEAMYHNLNTLQSRSGNQLPFSSINYGTCTLEEGRLVIKALLEVSIEGLGKLHKTSIFPCGIFQYMKGVNDKPGTPNYDLFQLALESTAKRLYPNYANIDWSGNAGYDINDPCTYFSTMGCRTANGFDINGLEQRKDGRGNICPVTIILPTLAMNAKEQAKTSELDIVDNFLQLLDTKIDEAKDMLIERFEWICSQSPSAAKFMYENHLMAGYIPDEGIRSALKHGTLAIGQLGLAETLQLLIGCDHTEERGMELAKTIEKLFNTKCTEYKNKYKLNFGVYYTPAENLCYTAMTKFKEQYGVIEKVSDKEYFTNSMHVPVYHNLNPYQKIDIESQLTGYSTAGCITYVELDSTCKYNLEALGNIVHYAMNKDIPYFAVNVPNDTCLECGYTGEFNETCPMCESSNIQQLRRVTGYLTGNYTTAFNKGKQEEVKDRVKHQEVVTEFKYEH